MKGSGITIGKFLNKGIEFTIPLYQRDYAWKVKNCKQLWEDILSLNIKIDKENKKHFLGAIASKTDNGKEYLIIDGQQRLTTIFLLLLALKKYNSDVGPINLSLERKIDAILKDEDLKSGELKLKLKPNKKDREAFNRINDDKISDGEAIEKTNITNNYKYFRDRLSENKIDLISLYDLIMDSLEIIDIELESQDDAQLIFESINSTGVHLDDKDIIRNYLLMGLSIKEMEDSYNNYWLKIEENVSDVNIYIRHFLTYKFREFISDKKEEKIYEKLKSCCLTFFDKDKTKLLKELYHQSLIYKRLETGNSNLAQKEDKQIDEKLYRLKSLNITSFYPVYLSIINAKEQGKITSENIIELLNIVECFMIRNIICGGSSKNFNKQTIPLLKIEFDNNYINTFVNKLFIKSGREYLSDRFFKDAFIEYDLYNPGHTKNFVLEHLENDNSDYPVDFSDLTIEHIMPQKLTENWKEKLGENWESTYNKYIHTIGNLTVVTNSKNSRSSNLPISEKYKLLDLKLTLNQTINPKNWNEELIVNRAKILLENALKIWKYPKLDTNKNSNEPEYFSLYEVDEVDEVEEVEEGKDSFKDEKPSRLKIEKEEGNIVEIEVQSWVELTVEVLKELYEYSPTEFVQLNRISDDKNKFYRPKEIIPGYYFEANKSADDLLKFILKNTKNLNYDTTKISFTIKEDISNQEE